MKRRDSKGAGDHIVASFDDELTRLSAMLERMGGLVESQMEAALKAFTLRNSELAQRVVGSDAEIDELEAAIRDFAIGLIALRQPMAQDLRVIVSAIRIAPDLERIGDYAKNIAQRSIAIRRFSPVASAFRIPRLAQIVRSMLSDVLDAYATGDVAKAREVWLRDAEVDELHDSLVRELLTYMLEDQRMITVCIHLLFMARNIERIGDHATNIAETTHYKVTGTAFLEQRPMRRHGLRLLDSEIAERPS